MEVEHDKSRERWKGREDNEETKVEGKNIKLEIKIKQVY